MTDKDDFSPERCDPDIKRLSYADQLSASNHPKNSIVSEYECNRFGVIYSYHTRISNKEIEDVDGDLGPPGTKYKSPGLPLCMGAIDRIWDSRPSVDGTHRNQTVTICKAGSTVVASGAAIPGLSTAEEAKKPGFFANALNTIRGTGTRRE